MNGEDYEFEQIMKGLGEQRARIEALLADIPQDAASHMLIEEITELSEKLLAADEELRVQDAALSDARADLETLAERYEELFAGASTPMFVTDLQGVIIDRNRATTALLGDWVRRSPGPAVSRFSLEDRYELRAAINAVASGRGDQEVTARVLDSGEPPKLVRMRLSLGRDPVARADRINWRVLAQGGEGHEPQRTDDQPLDELLRAVRAEVATEIRPDKSQDDMVTGIIHAAQRLIPGADDGAVSVFDDNGLIAVYTSGDRGLHLTEIQARVGQGPAIEPLSPGETLRVNDLLRWERWPMFTAVAIDTGVTALLTCAMPTTPRLRASITLYSSTPGAFSEASELVLPVFAARAGTVLAYADKIRNLHQAIDSRQVIGQATGILMERDKVGESAAFARLVAASQRTHLKLRDIALRIVETGESPETIGGS